MSSEAGIWRGFMRALGAEPETPGSLTGVSGVSHPVVAIGLDEPRRRLIVVSADPDPRTAALAHVDIQAAAPDISVVSLRPVVFDLDGVVNAVRGAFGGHVLDLAQLDLAGSQEQAAETLTAVFGSVLEGIVEAVRASELDWVSLLHQVLELLPLFAVKSADLPSPDEAQREPASTLAALAAPTSLQIDVSRLSNADAFRTDRQLGICPLPLYQFEGHELEVMRSGRDVDEIVGLLATRNVLQYFFPPADQLLLGSVDNGVVDRVEAQTLTGQAPGVGHPFGENELVDAKTPLGEMSEALRDSGLVAEAEQGLVLTAAGQGVRDPLRGAPREGLVNKLLNQRRARRDVKDRLARDTSQLTGDATGSPPEQPLGSFGDTPSDHA